MTEFTLASDDVFPRDPENRYHLCVDRSDANTVIATSATLDGAILARDTIGTEGTDLTQAGILDVIANQWYKIPPPVVTDGPPYPCPDCGSTTAWRADYTQAVHQGCTVVTGPDGQPEVTDYAGDEESYDDGSSENEKIRCEECGYEIVYGTHLFVPAPAEPVHAVDCDMDDDCTCGAGQPPRLMTALEAARILFGPAWDEWVADPLDPLVAEIESTSWASGADIAEALAVHFNLCGPTYLALLAQERPDPQGGPS